MEWAIADGLELIPKMVRRNATTILIHLGRDGLPALYPQKNNFEWELKGHCTHDGFYMHQVLLAYMVVFRHGSLGPGSSGSELSVVANRATAALYNVEKGEHKKHLLAFFNYAYTHFQN